MVQYMIEGIMDKEAFLRLGVFAGILIIMIVLELLIPKRKLRRSRRARWFTNVSLAVVNVFAVRLMAMSAIPLVAMSVAVLGASMDFGLFRLFGMPYWLSFAVSLLLLDLAIYFQHWASHQLPILWRLHRVHHSDQDIDVTTAVRFHPIEIGLSMLYKVLLVFLFGVDAFAVLVFEIILNGCAMFNHSNVALPSWLDRVLRVVIVTPDMHRVHHSIERDETDSNYGFNLAIWDRLFGTYVADPKKGHCGMQIGLPQWQEDDNPTKFSWSFLLPFSQKKKL